jgi:DNA polymerase
MHAVLLHHDVDFATWRTAARALATGGVPPEQVVWSVRAPDDLFAEPDLPVPAGDAAFSVPRAVVDLAQTVIQAREPARFALLYRLIWRLRQGERHLLDQTTDPDVHRAQLLAQAVRRDTHKMRAFLRFREVREPEGVRYVAWFEPEHHIVEANAAFFVRRFATMVWSILTPERSVHWTGTDLLFHPGASRAEVPDDDALEACWRAYFASIFNPARLNTAAMRREMPQKYWRNLPEAAAIPELVQTAAARTEAMIARMPAVSPPTAPSLADAAHKARACQACPLWQHATQTVFGEGPAGARLMLIGEQPGDQEDLAGRPFVGPAGQKLDQALGELGIDRRQVYVTNAVKHFKFEPRGKRRIHQSPDAGEVEACRFWLDLERSEVRPALTVLLGATAARAVLARPVTISRSRGQVIALPDGSSGLITVHPSYLLRLPDEDAKAREYTAFVADLRRARDVAWPAGGA